MRDPHSIPSSLTEREKGPSMSQESVLSTELWDIRVCLSISPVETVPPWIKRLVQGNITQHLLPLGLVP